MKIWLEDPPYKMTDEDLKLECFYSVMACAQALKGDELTKVLDGLELKEATALNKYVLAGMHMLDQKDSKTAKMVNYPMLMKAQLQMNATFG